MSTSGSNILRFPGARLGTPRASGAGPAKPPADLFPFPQAGGDPTPPSAQFTALVEAICASAEGPGGAGGPGRPGLLQDLGERWGGDEALRRRLAEAVRVVLARAAGDAASRPR